MIAYLTPFVYELGELKQELIYEGREDFGWQPFRDPSTQRVVPGWLVKRIGLEQEAHLPSQKVCETFMNLLGLEDVDMRPRFYWQTYGTVIKYHVDRGTLCSLNFVLQGESDYIAFPGLKTKYTNALLNTQAMHGVLAPTTGRLLFKLSIFNKPYFEVRNALQAKLPCEQASSEELRSEEHLALSSPQDGRV